MLITVLSSKDVPLTTSCKVGFKIMNSQADICPLRSSYVNKNLASEDSWWGAHLMKLLLYPISPSTPFIPLNIIWEATVNLKGVSLYRWVSSLILWPSIFYFWFFCHYDYNMSSIGSFFTRTLCYTTLFKKREIISAHKTV